MKPHHLIVPFLLGQRRDGLCRVRDVDSHAWEIVEAPEFAEISIADANEKIRRMAKIYALLSDTVEKAVNSGSVPVSVAGDCVSTLGVLGGLQKAGKPPDRILWLDAHGDFHTWGTTHTKYLGGMPLSMLVGRSDRRQGNRNAIAALVTTIGVKPFPEEKILLSDARDLDPGELEELQRSDIVTCSIADIVKHLDPNETLYLHFDTDVIDAEPQAPALKYHVKKGPGFAEMHRLFRDLRHHNIVAVSVSAWHEEKDLDNTTAIACLNLLKELELDASPS